MTVVETLTTALELMRRTGWVRHHFISPEGHCALGAIRDAQPDGITDVSLESLRAHGVMQDHPFHLPPGFVRYTENKDPAAIAAIGVLAQAVPEAFVKACIGDYMHSSDLVVARYNNTRTAFDQIEAWFNRAIDLAQAKEMWNELEKAPAVAEEKELKKGDVVCSLK